MIPRDCIVGAVAAGTAVFASLGCTPMRPTAAASTVAAADQPYAPYTNLQVLPQDTEWPALIESMLLNLRGLGLVQTGGQGCLHCHVGSMDRPMEQWDFASDQKRTKRNARVMMRMVAELNARYVGALEGTRRRGTEVTCYTCHAGRTIPQPLSAVLADRYSSGGMAAMAGEYERLRARYFGRDAYDFNAALTQFGVSLADSGSYEDAIRAVELDLRFDSLSVDANRWLIRLAVERAIVGGARDGLRPLVDSLSRARPDGAMVWFTLRSVGVRLRASGKLDEAVVAFDLNASLYPSDHRVVLDLAQTQLQRGDTAAAVAGARRSLALMPDYEPALDLLAAAGIRR